MILNLKFRAKIALGKNQLQTQVLNLYMWPLPEIKLRSHCREAAPLLSPKSKYTSLGEHNVLIIKPSEPITVRVQSAGNTRRQQRLACLICDWLTQCLIRSVHARNLRLLQFSPRAEIEADHCRCAQKSRPQLALR